MKESEPRPLNRDPLTGAPDSHPASTGAGAITGGLAGGVAGSLIAGPVGAAVGIGLGAVAGGLGGKAMAQVIDEIEEDAFWEENHSRQPYGQEADFIKYREAYRVGYTGMLRYPGARYEDIEADLEQDYGAHSAGLPWEKARHATREAWYRACDPRRGG